VLVKIELTTQQKSEIFDTLMMVITAMMMMMIAERGMHCYS